MFTSLEVLGIIFKCRIYLKNHAFKKVFCPRGHSDLYWIASKQMAWCDLINPSDVFDFSALFLMCSYHCFIFSVSVQLKRGENEHDAILFDVPRLRRMRHRGGRKFALHLSDLQSRLNSLQVYVDCVPVGKEDTKISLRDVLGGNQTVVSTWC